MSIMRRWIDSITQGNSRWLTVYGLELIGYAIIIMLLSYHIGDGGGSSWLFDLSVVLGVFMILGGIYFLSEGHSETLKDREVRQQHAEEEDSNMDTRSFPKARFMGDLYLQGPDGINEHIELRRK
jgi:hypothetical protein